MKNIVIFTLILNVESYFYRFPKEPYCDNYYTYFAVFTYINKNYLTRGCIIYNDLIRIEFYARKVPWILANQFSQNVKTCVYLKLIVIFNFLISTRIYVS